MRTVRCVTRRVDVQRYQPSSVLSVSRSVVEAGGLAPQGVRVLPEN